MYQGTIHSVDIDAKQMFEYQKQLGQMAMPNGAGAAPPPPNSILDGAVSRLRNLIATASDIESALSQFRYVTLGDMDPSGPTGAAGNAVQVTPCLSEQICQAISELENRLSDINSKVVSIRRLA